MNIKFRLIGLMISMLIVNMPARAESNVADEYIEAYYVFDVEKIGAFYADDAKFNDPTSEIFGKYAFVQSGKLEILKGLNKFVANYDEISMAVDIKQQYESAGHNVYTGMAKVTTVKGGVLKTSCAFLTTIISVKDEKVVEHRDYYDYKMAQKTGKTGDQNC